MEPPPCAVLQARLHPDGYLPPYSHSRTQRRTGDGTSASNPLPCLPRSRRAPNEKVREKKKERTTVRNFRRGQACLFFFGFFFQGKKKQCKKRGCSLENPPQVGSWAVAEGRLSTFERSCWIGWLAWLEMTLGSFQHTYCMYGKHRFRTLRTVMYTRTIWTQNLDP